MVISPELADVLAAVIHRIREPSGAVAAVASYDPHERIWNPPMPLLFQRRFGGGNRAIRRLPSRESTADPRRTPPETSGPSGRGVEPDNGIIGKLNDAQQPAGWSWCRCGT